MKRLLTALLWFASAGVAMAQITYPGSDFVTVGDSAVYFRDSTWRQTPHSQAGQQGASQTWTFPALQRQATFSYQFPAFSNPNFAAANALRIQAADSVPVTLNTNGLDLLRAREQAVPGITVTANYNNAQTQYWFPLSLNGTRTDTFGYTVRASINFSGSSSYVTATDTLDSLFIDRDYIRADTVDGTGTLVLGGDTLQNVVRVRSTLTLIDTVASFYSSANRWTGGLADAAGNAQWPGRVNQPINRVYTYFQQGVKWPVLWYTTNVAGDTIINEGRGAAGIVSGSDTSTGFQSANFTGPDSVKKGDTSIYIVNNPSTGSTFNWTVTNGTVIGSATGDTLRVVWNSDSTTGRVRLVETNQGGTAGTPTDVNVVIDQQVSRLPLAFQDVAVFPNPARDVVTVRGFNGQADFTLVNTMGQVVRTAQATNQLQLNVDDLPTGVYYLNMTQDGQQGAFPLRIVR